MPAKNAATFERPTHIQGVVTSAGGSLGKNPALVLFLRPWRDAEGNVGRGELRVEVPAKTEASVRRMMATWDGKTVGLSVVTATKAHGNFLERIVAKSPLRRVATARALETVVEEQRKPRRAKSRVLGQLELDRSVGWFEGKRRKGKLAYTLCVDTPAPDSDPAVAKAIERAEAVVLGVERGLAGTLDAIADELLETFNDGWRGSRPALSAAGFKKRLVLETVHCQRGRVTLYFDCRGLFADHAVEVRLSPRLAVREIGLAG